MARNPEYSNGLGIGTYYGPYDEASFGTCVVSFGCVQQMLYPVSFDAEPEGQPDTSGRYLTAEAAARDPEGDSNVKVIPAHSFIKSAQFYVTDAFAGGTAFGIGLNNDDGDGDDDGLISDLATSGVGWVDGDGALVGADIGDADLYLSSTVTGTYTGGAGILVVEYIEVPVV